MPRDDRNSAGRCGIKDEAMPMTAGMRGGWIATLVSAIGLSLSCAIAASDSIGFEGRRYHKAHEDLQKPADHIAEFVLPGETMGRWTTLITFHAFPQSPPDAVQAATALGRIVKSRDGEFNLVANPATSEALIDFIIPTADGMVEFNAFKYAPV